MQIKIENLDQKTKYLSIIQQAIETQPLCAVKYLDFGIKVIRVLCHTAEIVPFLEQQMSYVLRDKADSFDETISVGKINNIQSLICKMDDKLDPKINLRLRVEFLLASKKYPNIEFTEETSSKASPVIRCSASTGLMAYDGEKHLCYYGVSNFEPEEFIKLGHLFVQQLNVLLKSDTVNLTHGAVLGYDGKGALLCARGQRGKSTLTVHSLLNGCEYVSDDYQLLEKQSDGLYAYPLYSIITLSPEMYSKMYFDFDGKFCSNNARKDKYVFNISKYHHQFKSRYPIKLCLFPEIVLDEEPTIVPCSAAEKGRAIVQFIHSTVMQMQDLNDHATIAKLWSMVVDLPFYKFNLSPHISKNTEYLHQFLSQELPPVSGQENLGTMLLDITFDLANILDTQTFTFYSMNQFATNIYEMLLSGISADLIAQKLGAFKLINSDIIDEFNYFVQILNQKRLLQVSNTSSRKDIDENLAKTCKYKLSLLEFNTDKTVELIKKKGK